MTVTIQEDITNQSLLAVYNKFQINIPTETI